ncbi:MAG: class I tRNA ligase family protein, partial [Erysipelotrichaceae bacterium]|nr:class I tRNA ligase family protein [Erysipelotrichaceae bacterium]
SNIIRCLHPFMPFVTEEIYQALPHAKESICIDAWPTVIEGIDGSTLDEVDQLVSLIKTIREIKLDNNLKPSAPISILVKDNEGKVEDKNPIYAAILEKMVKATWLAEEEGDMMVRPIYNGSVGVPSSQLINIEEEIKKLTADKARLEKEIARGEGMLANPRFVEKAPEAKVNEEKAKLENYKNQYAIVVNRLKEIEK